MLAEDRSVAAVDVSHRPIGCMSDTGCSSAGATDEVCVLRSRAGYRRRPHECLPCLDDHIIRTCAPREERLRQEARTTAHGGVAPCIGTHLSIGGHDLSIHISDSRAGLGGTNGRALDFHSLSVGCGEGIDAIESNDT